MKEKNSKSNPPINAELFKKVCKLRGKSLRALAHDCYKQTKGNTYDEPDTDKETAYTELKRDLRKGTMSERRLTIFAKELNCAKAYLRYASSEEPFDEEHWSYDFEYWNELRKRQFDLWRNVIYCMPSYPTHFTYDDVQKLTDSDILEIMIQLRPEIDRIVEQKLNQRIYGIDTTTDK